MPGSQRTAFLFLHQFLGSRNIDPPNVALCYNRPQYFHASNRRRSGRTEGLDIVEVGCRLTGNFRECG